MKISTILFFLFFELIHAQNPSIVGDWLLTEVQTEGKVQNPYQINSFKKNGDFYLMEIKFGTWQEDKKKHTFTLKSKLEKDFNDTFTIDKLTENVLILSSSKLKLVYTSVNEKQIEKDNLASNLIGLWSIDNLDKSTKFIRFSKPNTFLSLSIQQEMTEKSNGSWMYNPKEKSVLIMGFDYDLRGKNKIQKITKDTLIFQHKDKQYIAHKKTSATITKLPFVYEDFPEENITNNQLPWNDFYTMIKYLKPIKSIEYQENEFIEDIHSFNSHDLIFKVYVDEDNEKISIKKERIIKKDTIHLQEIYKKATDFSLNSFYPLEELYPYKIISKNEKIKVPAGEFECTVVIGFIDETKVKLWMINNKKGIYAKVIKENKDSFDNTKYTVLKLKKIMKE